MKTTTISYRNYLITTDRTLMQPHTIHHWLSTESYWAKGIPLTTVEIAVDHSFAVGALHEGRQIGFARLVTDYATFAYLADVYVEEAHRGLGISKQMLQLILQQDWVQGLRRILLTTLDAHGLYAQFGFSPVPFPERMMLINKPDFYHQQDPFEAVQDTQNSNV